MKQKSDLTEKQKEVLKKMEEVLPKLDDEQLMYLLAQFETLSYFPKKKVTA